MRTDKIILVDQDGPLADFELGFFRRWTAAFPGEFSIPPDKRVTLKVKDQYPSSLREKVESICSAKGFYRDLPVVPGAVEALDELIDLGFDVRICTSPLSDYRNCVAEKYEWTERFFGSEFVKRLILTKDKTMIRGQYLIDDFPPRGGICEPEWVHLLYDAPYNAGIASTRRLSWSTWRDTLAILPVPRGSK